MINLLTVFAKLADDVGLDPYTVSYCVQRIKREGVRFLTVTLPKLSKAVLASLEKGYFDRPTDFAWKGRSLRYFRSLLNGIFGRDGKVLDNVDPLSIWRVRQLSEYLYKLALPFSDEQLQEAESRYLETEREVGLDQTDVEFTDEVRKRFESYYPEIAQATANQVFARNAPRFGPGAFSASSDVEGRHFNAYKLLPDGAIGTCAADYRAFSGYFKPYRASPTRVSSVGEVNYAEVLFVPKDSRGPRVISKEPMHSLRAQLSYFDWLSSNLERLTDGRVNFRDQSVNRALAARASLTKEYATLDLKDASDRLSAQVCSRIFRFSPAIRYFLRRRTRLAKLPSGQITPMKKLAGMGSGLTFATMAMVIYLGICTRVHQVYPYLRWEEISRRVYVYGDDVIVPVDWVGHAATALEKLGLRLNERKCFVTSSFRESCGGDFYLGQSVAPTRLTLNFTKMTCKGHTLEVEWSPETALKIERHCRQLWKDGMVALKEYYYSLLERKLGKLPEVCGESPYLGRYTFSVRYGVDQAGNHLTKKVFLPVPASSKESRHCPYKYLGNHLREVPFDRLEYLYGGEAGSTFKEFALPRKVRLVKREVSAFALMG